MERTRLVWIVAIVFIVGAFLGAALFYEGSSPIAGSRRADAVLVRVENDGHSANFTVTMQALPSGRTFEWGWQLGDGGQEVARYANPASDDIRVFVTGTYSDPPRAPRGDASYIVGADQCAGREVLFRIRANTATGMAFTRVGEPTCV